MAAWSHASAPCWHQRSGGFPLNVISWAVTFAFTPAVSVLAANPGRKRIMDNTPPEQSWDLATKLDILKHAQSLQMEEVRHRRTREYQIFSWTSGLLVALIGALLVFPRAPQTIWSAYGITGRLLASAAIAIFAVHTINWQYSNRRVG